MRSGSRNRDNEEFVYLGAFLLGLKIKNRVRGNGGIWSDFLSAISYV